MPTPQDKAAADVLDYYVTYKPETIRERWLFGLAIGIFLVLGAIWFYNWFDYYAAYRLFNGMKPLAYKIGRAANYILFPICIGLAISGLYSRAKYGYWIAGFFVGLMLFPSATYAYGLTTFKGWEVLTVPKVLLMEFVCPLTVIGYLLYFLTRSEVRIRCQVGWPTFTSSLIIGFLFGCGFMFLISGTGT